MFGASGICASRENISGSALRSCWSSVLPQASPGLCLGRDSGDGDFGLPRSCTDTCFATSRGQDPGRAQPGLTAPWGEEGAEASTPPGWQAGRAGREGLRSQAAQHGCGLFHIKP